MSCDTCINLIPIGEGDHICLECGDEPILILDNYEPTDDYYKCGGNEHESI